jgi:DNA-binding response OmpR family regulator
LSNITSEGQNEQQEKPEHLPEENDSFIQLGPDLWIDLDGGVIIRKQENIFLTAREMHVLRILVKAWRNGRQYISAQVIADRVGLSEVYNPEHSVEQTISLLRRKLGETPYRPRILHGRRGFGYRLFSETKSDTN